MTRKLWLTILTGFSLAFLFVAGCSSNVKAPKQEKPFYEGQVMTFIVSTKPGGGYDTYGRLIAQYMQKYLPGSTIVVKNIPGAGQITGTNELYMSKPDGLTIGITNTVGIITAQLRKEEGVKYDVSKFTWLGTIAQQPLVLFVGSNSKFAGMTLQQIRDSGKEIVLASPGLGTANHIVSRVLASAFNLKMKLVSGYGGQSEELAIMRGEVDGTVGSYDSWRNMLEQGVVKPVVRVGRLDIGVPLASEMASGEGKQMLEALDGMLDVSRSIAGPPGIPEDRTKILREALAKAVKDPDLLEQAKKAKLVIDYRPGEETAEIINKITTMPQNILEAINAAGRE